MTTTELLGQAAWVMIFGMGIVFSFLIILIGAIKLSNKIICMLGLNKNESAKPTPAPKKKEVPVAAIAAAVKNYRQKN
ncbi:MAG: OadG family protein [Spirochaetota bacterium]|nr:OadG family protein [Spirochaetota bacterium]